MIRIRPRAGGSRWQCWNVTTLAPDADAVGAAVPYLLFLSHSAKTEAELGRLERIAGLIEEAAGAETPIRVLFDREQISGGDDWRRRIAFLLHLCDGAAVLLDESALSSTWVWMEAVVLAMRQQIEDGFAFVPLSMIPEQALAQEPPARTVRDLLSESEWRHLALTDIQFVDGRSERDVVERLIAALRGRGALTSRSSPAWLLADQLAPLLVGTGRVSLARLAAELGSGSRYVAYDHCSRAALGLVHSVLCHGQLRRARAMVDGLGLRFCRLHGRELLDELAPLSIPATAALIARRRTTHGYVHSWLRCDNPNRVVPLYIRRAFLSSNPPRHFSIMNLHGTFEDLQAQIRLQYRLKYKEPDLDPLSEDDQDAAVDLLLSHAPGFVWVLGPVDADVLARLDRAYPTLSFVVHEPEEADVAALPAALKPLLPALSRAQERDLVADHRIALEGL
jgi:hypothetical protein